MYIRLNLNCVTELIQVFVYTESVAWWPFNESQVPTEPPHKVRSCIEFDFPYFAVTITPNMRRHTG